MDTSEVYIKMCREAKEIQKRAWEFEYGDYAHVDFGEPHTFIVSGKLINSTDGKAVWLPRQDQLQEMVYNGRNLSVFYGFRSYVMHHIVNDLDDTDEADLESWEQLWLTFVMKEKYNKSWNGKIWVKE